jgi:TolB protein
MSRNSSHAPALRALALSVLAMLAACQGATDPLAPDAAGTPEAVASPSSGEPAALVGTNRIAYVVRTSSGTSDLWSVNPQIGVPRQLTSFAGDEDAPSWSFDHSRLAFTRKRNGMLDIYLMKADGTGKRWARSTPYQGIIYQPSWSPNGSHLLVKLSFQQGYYLAKLDLATGNTALLAPSGGFAVSGSFPVYDPTGTWIYYRDDATGRVIKRFQPGGQQTTVLTSTWYLADLAFSPDGKKLAYAAAVDENNWEIFVLDLPTGVTSRRTYSAGTDARPTWSPDGTRLAFYSARTGKPQVHIMSLASGSVLPMTGVPYGAWGPAWLR